MALNFKLRVLLWLMALRKQPDIKTLSPEAFRKLNREGYKKLHKIINYEPEKLFKITDTKVPTGTHDIPIRIYQPEDRENLPILMFFHGGGFVVGDLESHDFACQRLAKLARCVVIAVDYRLAPEHKFPAAPEDCYAATLWAAENAQAFKGDATRMATCGDSAGGNLATVVAMMCREKGKPDLLYQVLIYPTTDATMHCASIEENGKGYILTKEMMELFMNHYRAEKTDLKEPYFSPLWQENLSGLPPALIITAEYDPLRDEGKLYADKLKRAGVKVVYKEYEGMVHVFFQMPKYLKKAREAQELVAKELRMAFGTDGIV